MSDSMVIQVFPSGPIHVKGANGIRFGDQALETGDEVYLCRCGQSKNAPFCDGSHRTNGFVGDAGPGYDREIRVWEGKTIRTHFNGNVCMHARNCKPLAALREAELAGDASAASEIARVVGECPSGALSFEMKTDAAAPAPAEHDASIHIIEGGEVRVQRAFEINADLPARMTGAKATLCRCGLSKNKPWCDGRHATRTDFR